MKVGLKTTPSQKTRQLWQAVVSICKQHQHTLKNGMLVSSFLLTLLAFKLLRQKWRILTSLDLCLWNSPAPLAGNTRFYLSRSVSAKQTGWPGNPVGYRIWRLMQECVYIVQDTCPWHQRLDAVHQRQMGKRITKRQSCWSMQKAVVCMCEGHHFEHAGMLN